MPLPQRHRVLAAAAFLAALTGCSTVDGYSRSLVNTLTPYKVEVVQGNFISREQVEALQKGMSREQVRNILGTPLVTSLFHGDRWDYVFTLKRRGVDEQKRHLAVFFKDDLMDRVEGDPMPSESEFVTTLDNKRKLGKVPRLEATEAELRAFQSKNQPAATASAAPAPAPAAGTPPTSYPPLESVR
ncbi:outer membrane protein assembly factor BamE [Ramlibacter cellulosilyticus]